MRIISVTIREFGGLRNFSLSFSDGINVIFGNNESGKSTVIAFIRFMFFGFSKRRPDESLSDGERSFSWENGLADGSMTAQKGQRIYRIERREQVGTPIKYLQIFDEETGHPLPKNESPESLFFGFPSQVFDSTCCIRQFRSGQIYGKNLTASIENLLLSGDETIDAKRAAEKLEKARIALLHKNGNGGEIHRLGEEIIAMNARLSEARAASDALRETEAESNTLKSEIAVAKKALESAEADAKAAAEAVVLARFNALHEDQKRISEQETIVKRLRAEYAENGTGSAAERIRDLEAEAEALEEYDRRRFLAEAEMKKYASDEPPYDPVLSKAAASVLAQGGSKSVLHRASILSGQIKKSEMLSRAAFVSAFCFALLFLLLAIFLHTAALLVVGIILFPLFFTVGFLLLRRKRSTESTLEHYLAGFGFTATSTDSSAAFAEYVKRAFGEAERARAYHDRRTAASEGLNESLSVLRNRRALIVRRFPADFSRESEVNPASLRAAAQKYRAAQSRLAHAEETLALLLDGYRTSKNALAEYDETALRAKFSARRIAGTAGNEASYREKCVRARERLQALEERQHITERRLSALEATCGDPPEKLVSLIEEKNAEHSRLEALHRAIVLASESLEAARTGLKSRVTPRLRSSAGQYLSEISGGKYASISVGTDFTPSAEENGRLHPSDAFSGGTSDAMYLSLRLSLCDLFSAPEDPLPLFLDEALSQLDDTRAAAMLRILGKRSENGGQILLFTCHTREQTLLSETKATGLSLR